MEKFNFFSVLLAVVICQCSCSKLVDSVQKETDLDTSPVIKNGECGGTIELDRGTVIYPGGGSIQPGEVCIWTIHLRTMDGFRMNFTNLNVPGGDSSCGSSAVSFYGLSNLTPRDDFERYRLCNENNNVGNYFLTSNLAVVTFYASSSFPPNNSALGFALHWEGSRFQPIPTEHSATYSIAPSGVIWYPFEGEYPSNAAMTWQVKGVRSTEPTPSLLDIDVIFVDLENCNLNDKCLCDAVIIYDISDSGELHEIDRFCGEKSNGQFQNVNSNFIVGFYTDGVNTPGSGYGFQAVWRQGTQQPSTTVSWSTTNDPPTSTYSTTTGPPTSTHPTTIDPPTSTTSTYPTTTETTDRTTPIPVTECGGTTDLVHGDFKTIRYKWETNYDNNERCVWTIRTSPSYTGISFLLDENGFQLGYDYISIFGFAPQVGLTGSVNLGQTSNGYGGYVNGSVVIVVFSSDASITGTGFFLQFHAIGSPQTNVANYYDFHTEDFYGSLRYPSSGSYRNLELSTFVITVGDQYDDRYELFLDLYSDSIQSCGSNCSCDGLVVYELIGDRVTPLSSPFCGQSSYLSLATKHTAIVLFYSDSSTTQNGFGLHWETVQPTTPYPGWLSKQH